MVGELYSELQIKLFYTPNPMEEFGHALIRAKPTEPMDICKERAKRKPNHTIYCGLRREQNCPRYPLFDDNVMRHGVTIRVGVNFIPKNPIKVLHYHKIQLQLNVS